MESARSWTEIKPQLQKTLLAGEYEFSPLSEMRFPEETRQIWNAQDALVLKAMAIVLGEYLDPVLSDRCFHLKGRGGAKAAVRDTLEHLDPNAHVMKSDVQGYYASIDHEVLFGLVQQYVPDRCVLRLVWQYMQRTVCYGGLYWTIDRGISLGCPLSLLATPRPTNLWRVRQYQVSIYKQDILIEPFFATLDHILPV